MNEITILFMLVTVLALIVGGLFAYSDWKESHKKIHGVQQSK